MVLRADAPFVILQIVSAETFTGRYNVASTDFTEVEPSANMDSPTAVTLAGNLNVVIFVATKAFLPIFSTRQPSAKLTSVKPLL